MASRIVAEYAHLDGTGRVINVIVIEPDVAADYAHLVPLPEDHSVGRNWHTADGGATFTDKREHYGPGRLPAVPFTLHIGGSIDDLGTA